MAQGDTHNKLKTACKYGHEYDMVYVQKSPRTGEPITRRGCSVCRERARQRYRIKKYAEEMARNA